MMSEGEEANEPVCSSSTDFDMWPTVAQGKQLLLPLLLRTSYLVVTSGHHPWSWPACEIVI